MKFKPTIIAISLLIVVILMVPSVLVIPFTNKKADKIQPPLKAAAEEIVQNSPIDIAVYRSSQKSIENVPIEEYVNGVVAAEMPADFELEALKAQALSARTFVVRQLMAQKKDDLPEGAMISDTVQHQVYKSPEELKNQWGKDFNWKWQRIKEAVKETEGKILMYGGKPIEPSFFSTSNGYTENSEDYWENAFPYLRSVPSPWDKKSPKYLTETVMSVAEFEKRLGIRLANNQSVGTILGRTAGKRVAMIEIGGKKFNGRGVREKLDLRSSDFTWKRKGDEIIITTKGYGHGVGMSQYGANGMAREGKSYKDIISHYYKGVDISSFDPFVATLTARK